MTKYRIAYRDSRGEVHHFRKVYIDLIGVQSAVDDYRIGEPETELWYEPIEDEPIAISKDTLIIKSENLI